MDRGFIFIVHPSNLSIRMFFIILLNREFSPFHLTEALHDFSLAHPICQHDYSWALGPLLNIIRVTWTQAWWLVSDWRLGSVYRVSTPDRGLIDVPGGTARNFISSLRTVCNLNDQNVFCISGMFYWIVSYSGHPKQWIRGFYCSVIGQAEVLGGLPGRL